MATKTLTRAWLYAGTMYGPGEVETGAGPGQLSQEAEQALEAKGAFEPAPDPDSRGIPAPGAPVVQERGTVTERAPLINTVAHPTDTPASRSANAKK